MRGAELYNDDSNLDPPARFATDAEIELAEQLLRQLEQRYFGPPAPTHTGAAEGD